MPRAPRIDAPDTRHHVMNRGARRAPIFGDESHCGLFLELLAELPERFGCAVHGFALMPNHFHLMLESRRGELSRAMGYLQSRYAVLVNRHGGWDGPLFRGRFRNRVVWHEHHWVHLLAYLHLNPVRARLVVRPEQADWTSHRCYVGLDSLPGWLTTSELLEAFGGVKGYRQYLADLLAKRGEEPEGFDAVLLRGRTTSDEDVRESTAAPVLTAPRDALGEVARAAGVKVSSLRKTRRGRVGNPARVVAAWWLVQASGLTTIEAGKKLAMRAADVSKAISKVRAHRECDDAVGRLVRALEEG